MRRRMCWALLAWALLLSGCGGRAGAPVWAGMIADAQARYAQFVPVAEDPADKMGVSDHAHCPWQPYLVAAPAFQRGGRVSGAQAAQDVSALFDLLATYYGPYGHFGGDAVFDPARDRLIADWAGRESVTGAQFEDGVRGALGEIITDAHFTVNGKALNPRQAPYFAEESLVFGRDEAGYFRLEDGLRLRGADGYALEEILSPSLTASGEAAYRLCLLAPDDSPDRRVTLRYADGSAQSLELTTPYRYPGGGGRYACALAEGPRPGVAVLTLTAMATAPVEEPDSAPARDFVAQVRAAREADTLVLDLRDNAGGHRLLVDLFMCAYTGRDAWASKCRRAEYPTAEDATLGDYWPVERTDTGILLGGRPVDRLGHRPTVIVLVNKNTASSAETLCDELISCPDVDTLLVGVNTRGAVIGGMGMEPVLPNTHLRAAFGLSLCLSPEGYCPETAGLAPDLWVQGDALEAVLALLDEN